MSHCILRRVLALACIGLCALPGTPARFVPESAAQAGATLEVPYILWGGDVATFLANGGLETQPKSIFAQHGLKLKLTPGDDFGGQVKNYLSGKSPFLRGTMSMLAQAAEDLAGGGAGARPVVFLQLTWSAGDHLVSRPGLKTLGDLKGKKIALQKGGPHVGMLGDVLLTARLGWKDVQVVWTKDVTGPDGPAELFRKDASVDACFAITPDMDGLTGGLDKTGTGKETTVKGAHVLVSTAHMKRSIADVYACRQDFYDKNKETVEKFAAGYLKGCEDLLELRRRHGGKEDPEGAARYKALLALTQKIYGTDAIKSEADAAGLIDDAVFVGLPGNKSFFTEKGNLSGFEGKLKVAHDTALALGDVKKRHEFRRADLDYEKLTKLGGLAGRAPPQNRFVDKIEFLIENTVYSFTINFEPNQSTFPVAKYGEDFQRALEQASLFGNAVVAVRGHADPNPEMLKRFRERGLNRKIFTEKNGELYLKDGSRLDLSDMKKVVNLIAKEDFADDGDLKEWVRVFQKLSEERSQSVLSALVGYSDQKGYKSDRSQFRSVGAGCSEPVVAVQKSREDHQKNRRVEFRIIKVTVESRDFDY